jgi:hypothetical protein
MFQSFFNRNKKPNEVKFEGEFSFRNAIEYYKRVGVNIAPGKSVNEIKETEQRLDFKFPEDFKKFHSMCN